ncbi:uncharacterized protein LOC6524170 [Drosophila yakuba]|uniref:Uncharacterized protein n=1 Tax=Drosophila yakuba TaxID=7245 RepID=B4PZS4_DROYA|nr:uncharacterized protein LOC6524170 [Drosophila yakuba]EDX01141.1 uncharacterized protein Dyak_GE16823 [Drosophila yakuba]
MNRQRINQMRQMDRGQEGLQQVIQMQGQPQGQAMGNQQDHHAQTVRRKTTYTRTEMLSRGLPSVPNSNRSARNCTTAGQDWSSQISPKQRYTQPPAPPQPAAKVVIPATPLVQSTNATNKNNSTLGRQRSFLPRVARLPNKVDKSPARTLNRTIRDTELHVEQSRQQQAATGGSNQKGAHLMNTPHGSDSSMLAASGDNQLISDSSSSMENHKIKLAKAIRLPDEQNKSFVYVCKPVKKVKALLTARRLRTSCEHLNGLKEGEFCLQDEETFQLQRTISEEALHSRGAGEGYTLSPVEGLAPTSSTSSQLDSPTLAAMLQRQQQFEAKAVCSQERLRVQLREVRQRQRQLRQLEQDQQQQQQQHDKEQRQLELDQMCQNLPALRHEIHMLQQLGEKLEATLRVSSIPKPRSTVIITDISQQSSGRFYTPRTSPFQLDELPIRKLGFRRVEQLAVIRSCIMGTVCHVGLVQEFRIETKTLNELKTADESQCFYLPAPKEQPALTAANEADALQPTNFRKLRENPNMLLQQLRQVPGTGRPFNLLDQDTMFFNSLAYADPKTLAAAHNAAEQLEVATRETGGGGATMAHYGGAIAYSRLSVRLNEVGVASTASGRSAEQADRCSSQVNNTTQTEFEVPRLGKQLEPEMEQEAESEPETEISSPDYTPNPSPRLSKRKKVEELRAKEAGQAVRKSHLVARPMKMRNTMRRRAPEPPIKCRVEPKVRLKLFKTVLVGMVQVAVILVLIMAFTYPDVSC